MVGGGLRIVFGEGFGVHSFGMNDATGVKRFSQVFEVAALGPVGGDVYLDCLNTEVSRD